MHLENPSLLRGWSVREPRRDVPEIRFTETDAQRILARAAELEATSGSVVSIDELRAIAADAGIDPSALNRAVREFDLAPAGPSKTVRSRSRSLLGTAALAAAGVVLGALAVAADNLVFGSFSAAGVLGPSAAFTAYLALRNRRHGGPAAFLGEAAIVFGSFSGTVVAMEGFQALSTCMAWALMCSLAGLGIVTHGRRADGRVPVNAGS